MLVNKYYQESCIVQAFRNFSFKQNSFFLLIQRYSLTFDDIFFSRTHFAKEMGVCEKTIDRWCQDFIDLELMTKTRSLKNRFATCHYKLTQLGKSFKSYSESIYKSNKYVFLSVSLLVAPAIPDVQLCLSSKVFNTGVVRLLSKRELLTAPARDPQTNQNSQTTARKEADVASKEQKPMDIAEHISHLTPLLQLTTHGQLKLSMFDKETTDYAWETVKLTSGCKDVFKEFVDLCLQYCKDNELAVDWASYYNALESGLANKKDFCTAKRITSAMIKPRVVKDSRGSETQAKLVLTDREKMRQKQKDWEAKQEPQALEAKKREFLVLIENLTGVTAPADVRSRLGEVEVVVPKPMEWSQTDKQLVDWCLNYIGKMTTGKAFYAAFEQEILLGPYSPRAKTGELQEGLKLMQRLAYREIANQVIEEPLTKVVTELKDQIVCAQIANDDAVWENLKYSPMEDDGVFEEVLD